MDNFFTKQAKKEVESVKRIGKGYLKFLVISWGLIGVICLFSPAWLLGLGLCGSAFYVWYRIKSKPVVKKETKKE